MEVEFSLENRKAESRLQVTPSSAVRKSIERQ
jgi:hypothetical protein